MSSEVHPIFKERAAQLRNETHDERYQEDKEKDSSYFGEAKAIMHSFDLIYNHRNIKNKFCAA
jgi:hypothetical protein